VKAEEYLRRVASELGDLPWNTRRELVAELRDHLSELPPDPDLEARLGTPEAYASDLRAAAGLERRRGAIARVRARRPRNVVLAIVALVLIGLAIGSLAWIQTYQPLAFRGTAPIGGASLVDFAKGRPFKFGVDVMNTGRFTVRVLGVGRPFSQGPPLASRLLMSRAVAGNENPQDPALCKSKAFPVRIGCGAGFVRPRGPYERFRPFDLKPGQARNLLIRGAYGSCHFVPSLATVRVDAFPIRYSFLWKTATAQIPLLKEREIIPPNRDCRSASSRFPRYSRLTAGQRVVLRAGTVEAGSRIYCLSHGVRAGALVPKRGQSVVGFSVIGTAYVPSGGATIHLTTRTDGSVVARCR
jgi:hypothetical protein